MTVAVNISVGETVAIGVCEVVKVTVAVGNIIFVGEGTIVPVGRAVPKGEDLTVRIEAIIEDVVKTVALTDDTTCVPINRKTRGAAKTLREANDLPK